MVLPLQCSAVIIGPHKGVIVRGNKHGSLLDCYCTPWITLISVHGLKINHRFLNKPPLGIRAFVIVIIVSC